MSEPDDLPPFPVLMDEPAERWQWPLPPFDWRHEPAPDIDVAQPCRIEAPSGATVQGFMSAIDPGAATLAFRTSPGAGAVTLPFSRFVRLTLTDPLKAEAGRLTERVPLAAHEREVRWWAGGDAAPRVMRSAGHVQTEHGLFLFPPVDHDGRALLREFIPRAACERCEVGPSAQDLAAEHWMSTPRELLEAIERQRRMPVLPLGQSLLNLGLVTQEQLDRALAQHGDSPLGERLVDGGILSRADLHTAIAHKMGYPLVDLTRFPIDPQAAAKLPLRSSVKHRALPILIDADRLIVAVDRPARVNELQTLYSVSMYTVVPVLASKNQILLALSAMTRHDTWSANVSMRAEFFSTTR
ncbi:MAG TPA: hypothetical protein VF169_13225 [Albitalea sp.]|uniref:GspE/PulE/PilB domain-containing protein n=1 Tax=Piscinibacter sp. TaxID=1903157 RepID=UPI002ED5B741